MTASERHVALLVEDDAEMAAELGELLESIGHACIHASNKEDAERLAEVGEFCYALLDLEIKATPDSIRARVEAGETLRAMIRTRYPRRNTSGEHLLPILQVSAHADAQHIIGAFRDRLVDDYIVKPIGTNQPPFKEKIEAVLRKSGRERHEHCAALTRQARADAIDTEAGGDLLSLSITGQQHGKRFEIRVGPTMLTLTYGSFVILLKLVVGKLKGGAGWVHKNELGARDDQGWKGMSRVKQELAQSGVRFENDGSGQYRLSEDVAIASVETDRLDALDDATLAKLATQIRALRR